MLPECFAKNIKTSIVFITIWRYRGKYFFLYRFSVLRQPTGPDNTNGFALKRSITPISIPNTETTTTITTTTTTSQDKTDLLESNNSDTDIVVSVSSEQEVRKIPSQELPSSERIDEQVAALSVS